MPSVTTSILPVWQLRGVCFWAWKPWGRLHIWKKFLKGFRCIPSHPYHFHSYFRCTNKRISTSESWHLRIIWKIMRFSIVPSYGAVVGEMYTCHQLIKIYIYTYIQRYLVHLQISPQIPSDQHIRTKYNQISITGQLWLRHPEAWYTKEMIRRNCLVPRKRYPFI